MTTGTEEYLDRISAVYDLTFGGVAGTCVRSPVPPPGAPTDEAE